MKSSELKKMLAVAVQAAKAAGKLMRQNLTATKRINAALRHDIKLELDVRCQKLIEKTLLNAFPNVSIFGEEGVHGPQDSDARWVVDPIDGTVNYAYGIPHACVSIALQQRQTGDFSNVVGVVYDPFCDELWTAIRGEPARLNGRKISVSKRTDVADTVVSVGFPKGHKSIQKNLAMFGRLAARARKVRLMGSAALSLAYVASGRFDAYAEWGLRPWDVAAGALLVECAGGEYWSQPVAGSEERYWVVASNGAVRKRLQPLLRYQLNR